MGLLQSRPSSSVSTTIDLRRGGEMEAASPVVERTRSGRKRAIEIGRGRREADASTSPPPETPAGPSKKRARRGGKASATTRARGMTMAQLSPLERGAGAFVINPPVTNEQHHRNKSGRRSTLASCTSPGATFLTPHSCFNLFHVDIWTEVAKYLDGKDLVRLGVASRWFDRLMTDESIWRYALLRDLQAPLPRRVSFSWRELYASAFDGSHSYAFRQQDKHIDWMRIGAFFLASPVVLLTETLLLPKRLPRVGENALRSVQTTGTCVMSNVRTGTWIADLQLVRCPVCNLNTCEGTMQVLDARHLELFLEGGFKDGSWEYEDVVSHRIEKPATAATGAIFEIDAECKRVSCATGILNTNSWIGKADDWQPKARLCQHAVGVNTNLQPNDGLQIKYQVMRNGAKGEAVSIKISQQLI